MHRRADAAPRRPLAPRAAATLLATGLVLVGAALPAQAAPAGYARWAPLTGTSGNLVTTMTQRPAGFPVAAVRSTGVAGSGVGVQSGASTFLAPQTPPGAVYGSSRDQGYLNLRPAGLNAGPPSVTTYTFERPTPASGWTFVLGDVDADAVVVTATGADGAAVDPPDLGFSGVFNSCARGVTPKPTCGPPGNDGTDLPSWDEGTATLRGNEGALDTAGASGWFQPRTALRTLTFRYSQRAGSPVYQTWFSSLQFDLAGTVSAPDDLAAGCSSSCSTPPGRSRRDPDRRRRRLLLPRPGALRRLPGPVDGTGGPDLRQPAEPHRRPGGGGPDRRRLRPPGAGARARLGHGNHRRRQTARGCHRHLHQRRGRHPRGRHGRGRPVPVRARPGRGRLPARRHPAPGRDGVPGPARGQRARRVRGAGQPAGLHRHPGGGPATGVVEGTVADVAGDPVTDAEVTLEPATTDADAVTATSDEDGRFSCRAWSPGPTAPRWTRRRLPDAGGADLRRRRGPGRAGFRPRARGDRAGADGTGADGARS